MRLYVIGVAYYFALGGNHRLSVARCQSVESKKEERCR
jgi:uncharacterized ParB-like nuclease family protein